MQEQEAYTLTYLVGRTKKGQPYLASHIDRSFLTGERMINPSFASHINRDRMKNNVYSCFLNNVAGENFTEYELNCYEMLFSKSLEAQNERHRKAREYSRIRKMGNYYKSPRTCPEEEILQIGDKDNCPPVELFVVCVEDYIAKFRTKYGSNCILLDCGIHNDEATPHAHIRRVWVYESEDGLKVSQTQALKELKFATPNPDRAESRYNNPKMAFTAEDRQLWEKVCRMHGIEICESMSNCTSIDLTYLDTAQTESMQYMFYNCSSLGSLDMSAFTTFNVTDMQGMFYGCSGLTSLDVRGFVTSGVTSMKYMFYGCHGLTSLDLSSFNTSKVTSMGSMFYGCYGLTSLDLSNFDTSHVTDMVSMFRGCSGLTSLDLSNFNTSKITGNDLNYSFYTTTGMAYMFYGCYGLTSLDLSSFDTSSVVTMYRMFGSCSHLEAIYVSEKWSTDNVTISSMMFTGCSCLVGGNGTEYDSNNVSATYACIDTDDTPGYFTDIADKE